MKPFYNCGYGNGCEKNDDGYYISHGSIPSKSSHRYVDVWSAFDGLPPEGQRIMNGEDDFFYRRDEAIQACVEHNKGRKVA